ncbi:cryptochrome/photolyase family protein [Nocardioides cynanchi]|uniref:cryptochrome/photolyase family protein n=1 Tax=Nocardioides cynanchi TaxID=2558918 RepID=UPI00192DC518|nr:cryptochrome/photolyase family protein [Nocardioides cynanchi]
MTERHVRLVLPHQLFESHLDAPAGTTFVLVEHDLMFRQYRFHVQKLVLHRAALRRFGARLRERGYDVVQVDTDRRTTSRVALAREIRRLAPTRVTVYDVVDDWLSRDLTAALAEGGYRLAPDDVADTPNFLTTRAQLAEAFDGTTTPRMQHFYAWQRKRLDVLVTEDGAPEGGRWSFDEENRKKLPRRHPVPDPQRVDPPTGMSRSRTPSAGSGGTSPTTPAMPRRSPGRRRTPRRTRPSKTSWPPGSRSSGPTRTRCRSSTPSSSTRC